MSDREPRTLRLPGSGGLTLAADEWGDPAAPTVLLLHGGGQTRHSWKTAGAHLAAHGLHAVALDSRGHGDSDWAPTRDQYRLEDLCADVLAVLPGLSPPVTLVGASMGGLVSLRLAATHPELVARLILVDIVVRMEPEGIDRIREFMRSAPDGFATLEDAADAVAAYLPHRPRPHSVEGLRKNLRLREGRWHWHWDPTMFAGGPPDAIPFVSELDGLARQVQAPTLLLRGAKSDIVSDEGVEHFTGLIPHVSVASLDDAAHTAAADDNDAFTAAVVGFITAERP